MAVTPDGRQVISVMNDRTLEIWNLVTDPEDSKKNKRRRWPGQRPAKAESNSLADAEERWLTGEIFMV